MTVDEILAHHEAGHAVAALELRIPFIDVTLAKVRVPPGTFDYSDLQDVERDAIFTLAGEYAEACVHEDLGYASDRDRKHLQELSIDRFPDEPHRRPTWESKMEDRANLLVQEHWGKIERLAVHLLTNKVITRAQAIEYLQWPTSRNVQSIVWDK